MGGLAYVSCGKCECERAFQSHGVLTLGCMGQAKVPVKSEPSVAGREGRHRDVRDQAGRDEKWLHREFAGDVKGEEAPASRAGPGQPDAREGDAEEPAGAVKGEGSQAVRAANGAAPAMPQATGGPSSSGQSFLYQQLKSNCLLYSN